MAPRGMHVGVPWAQECCWPWGLWVMVPGMQTYFRGCRLVISSQVSGCKVLGQARSNSDVASVR